MKIVEVEWVDSMSEGRWKPVADVIREATDEAMLHRSVGYLVHECEGSIVLAGSRGESGDMVADTMQIPRVAVLRTKVLRSG